MYSGRSMPKPSAQGGEDLARGLRGVLVFPESKDFPARSFQMGVGFAVAYDVSVDFGAPPSCVCLRPRSMRLAAMPKTAVDEDRHARTDEGNVGPPTCSRQRGVDTVAEAEVTQRGSKGKFARRVAAPRYLHSSANRRRGRLRPLRRLPRGLLRSRAAPRPLRPT